MQSFKMGFYRNNKTGMVYCATDLVTDATNAALGAVSVLYSRYIDTRNARFVRHLPEFLEKFTYDEKLNSTPADSFETWTNGSVSIQIYR